MEHGEFNKLLDEILQRTIKVLASKSAEYSTDSDKLHNFKRAGAMEQCSPEKALIGMWTKHIISLLDIVDILDKEDAKYNGHVICRPQEVTISLIEEKIGDAINYLILLEALIKERYKDD